MLVLVILFFNTLCCNASFFIADLNYQQKSQEKMSYQDYLEDFQGFAQWSEDFLRRGQKIITSYEQAHLAYLHRGYELDINEWFYQFFKVYQEIELFAYQFGENFPSESDQFFYFVQRLQGHLLGQFLLVVAEDYDVFRYLEEGDLYEVYEENSFSKLERQYLQLQKQSRHPPPFSGHWEDIYHVLNTTTQKWHWWDETEKKQIERIKDRRAYNWFLRAGGVLVKNITELLSKREGSFSLRVWTNFRENYLRAHIKQVEQILVRELSLHPGDILAEKDLQSNTDLVIPGYWGHNGVYLGTISVFRQLNIWPHIYFKKIREYILSYQYDRDKLKMMEKLELLSSDFEQIHWVLETNRDGVKVIPLRQFLSIDGLALLRANRSWSSTAYKNLFYRANYFMGKKYDHTHDVRNKRGMTCSKFIGYLYSEITFPVTHFHHYLMMGPDQIVSAINRDFFQRDQGSLRLLAFFDASDFGRLKYHYHFLPSKDGYQQFVATLPPID